MWELLDFRNNYKQSCAKKGINLSLTVWTDVPKHPGRKGGVPSTARRSSPKLAINERVKRLYPQSSIPNINPFRLKQMNFRINVCQGCRGPLQSSLGTVTDAPFDFVWPERSGGLTKTLKRDSYARPLRNRMHIITFGLRAFKQLSRHLCRVRWSSPTDCLSQSATKTTLQKSSVWEPVRINWCHCFFFFMFLCLVWPVYIAVEVQFYICFRFIILLHIYIYIYIFFLHGNKLKMKNKSYLKMKMNPNIKKYNLQIFSCQAN